MPDAYKPLSRLRYLDGLRGFAALYVILFHTLLVSAAPVTLGPGAREFIGLGGTGVYLFFVISGFSLAMTMPRHIVTGQPLLSYTISRIFRIVPLFYLVLGFITMRSLMSGAALMPRTLLVNVTFLFNLFAGKQEGIVPASWTIGVEMLFYAVFPVIYSAGLRTQIVIFCILQAGYWAMLATLPTTYTVFTVIGWMPLFLIGMWAFPALGYLSRSLRRKRSCGAAMIVVAFVILILCASAPSHIVDNRLVIAFGYALLVVGLGLQAPGTFSFGPLLFLGRISYSTYLIHALVIMELDPTMVRLLAPLSGGVAYMVRVSVVLALVLPFAWLLTRFVEMPIEGQGRRVTRWWSERRSVSHPQYG